MSWLDVSADAKGLKQCAGAATVAKPPEASGASTFHESGASTVEMSKAAERCRADAVTTFQTEKAEGDEGAQSSSRANRCCGKSIPSSAFGLDVSEK